MENTFKFSYVYYFHVKAGQRQNSLTGSELFACKHATQTQRRRGGAVVQEKQK